MRFILMLVLLVSCGSEREITPVGGGQPVETPSGGETLTFNEVKPVIQTYCAPCHSSDAFIKSSTGWFQSAAPTRVKNLTMPPPSSTQGKGLSAADRQKLLNFK